MGGASCARRSPPTSPTPAARFEGGVSSVSPPLRAGVGHPISGRRRGAAVRCPGEGSTAVAADGGGVVVAEAREGEAAVAADGGGVVVAKAREGGAVVAADGGGVVV